jgi:hypothetical protein
MKRLFALLLFFVSSFAYAVNDLPISPATAGTKTISCTSSSAATQLFATADMAPNLEIQNVGTSTIFVEVGISTVTAAVATGYPILAGQSKVITAAGAATHIACITASATVTLYVTSGIGQ